MAWTEKEWDLPIAQHFEARVLIQLSRDVGGLTPGDVCNITGITRWRLQYIEEHALRKFRQALANDIKRVGQCG